MRPLAASHLIHGMQLWDRWDPLESGTLESDAILRAMEVSDHYYGSLFTLVQRQEAFQYLKEQK